MDYARFGRQIALAELGERGQRALADAPVRFAPEPPDAPAAQDAARLASELHARAGGAVSDDPAGAVVTVVVRLDGERASSEAARRGVAAACAVEAARRVLGRAPADVPGALRERLGAAAGGTST